MELRVRLRVAHAGERIATHDLRVTADPATTTSALALALANHVSMPSPARGAPGRLVTAPTPEFPAREATLGHQSPLSLRVTLPGYSPHICAPETRLNESGIQSGALLEVVTPHPRRNLVPSPTGQLIIVAGPQQGQVFSLQQREYVVGRDPSCDIQLTHLSVSRRHARLSVTRSGIFLSDLRGEERVEAAPLRLPTLGVVRFGAIPVRVVSSPAPVPAPRLTNTHAHLPSVRVIPQFTPPTVQLPQLPPQRATTRFPTLAVAAPLLMAMVWYLAARSSLSLMMLGVSPLVALMAWLGAVFVARRGHQRAHQAFDAELAAAERLIEETHHAERALRDTAHPTTRELFEDAVRRGPRLWGSSTGASHPLTFRVGRGTVRSAVRTTALGAGGQQEATGSDSLLELQNRAKALPGAAIAATLSSNGAFAIVGPPSRSAGVLNSVLVQLCAQYSPTKLAVAGFFAPQSQSASGWAAWLPHVDTPHSPLTVSHLSVTAASAAALIGSLEELTQLRRTETSRVPHPARRSAVVVIVANTDLLDRHRLVALAETGPEIGVHVVWCGTSLSAVPAACSTVLDLTGDEDSLHLISDETSVNLDAVESLTTQESEQFARSIAAVVDAGGQAPHAAHALPERVALAELLPPGVIHSARAVVANWHLRDSNTRRWRRGAARSVTSLTAPVGRDGVGTVTLDLLTDGPHALIGGTTGSGKSEFLLSWILSLAAHVSPDRLTFLFIDYKGGAAFTECASLPHSVGLVTDLDPRLAERVLVSLRAEIRSREQALARAAVPDLDTMERRSNPGAPPRLLVVIDEFAALRQDAPEFLAGVTDLAQRGRSLGIHLILATQRPAGAISDDLRANTNLRVSLRTADEADSRNLLGDSSAATFSAQVPGRAAWVLGSGSVRHFQSATTGVPPSDGAQERIVIAPLWPESSPRSAGEEAHPPSESGPRDSARLITTITRAALRERCSPPRRPWVEPLATSYSLDEAAKLSVPEGAGLAWPRLIVGVRDEPDQQRHSAFSIQLAEAGNVAVFGGPGSGRTTALLTIAAAAVRAHPDTTVYGIDGGDGTLSAISGLPGVGSVIQADAHERATRLCKKLAELSTSRQHRTDTEPGPVLLLVDGITRIREADDRARTPGTVLSLLTKIAHTARGSGVHLLLSAERAGGLPPDLSASFPERLTLRPTLPEDLQLMGLSRDALHSAPPGRAIRIQDGTEVQLALPGLHAESAVDGFARWARERDAPSTFTVPEIPQTVQRSALPPAPDQSAAFALHTASFCGVAGPEAGLALISGPPKSGRTTAILSLLETLAATDRDPRDRGHAVTGPHPQSRSSTALLSPHRRSPLAAAWPWDATALTPATQRTLLTQVTAAVDTELGAPRPAGPALFAPMSDDAPVSRPVPAPMQWPAPGARGVLVIEDIGAFVGSGIERELGALLQRLRHSEILTLVEGENATLSSTWELAAPLRGVRWALALRPDEHDTPAVFSAPFTRMIRAGTPPGRGLLVRGGDTHGVQVGLPEAPTHGPPPRAGERHTDHSPAPESPARPP